MICKIKIYQNNNKKIIKRMKKRLISHPNKNLHKIQKMKIWTLLEQTIFHNNFHIHR